ncbi:MAG: phosphatase PAP2 family protein [Chloroflexota bacterium]|nr:MAG: phosphatase PAP2 family protein [Chloroflexota bacterium]
MNGTHSPALQRRVILSSPLAVTVYVLCAIAFVVLAVAAHQANAFPGDVFITRQLQSIDSPIFDALMEAVTRIGFFVPSSIIVILCALGFAIARRPVEVLFILLTATGDGITELVKILVARPRPSSNVVNVFETLREYGFPSAHVTHYVIFYGFLFFLFWTLLPGSWLRTVALLVPVALMLLVGPSRIYLGAHWASDVLGAYLLGGLWLVILIEAYSTCKEKWTSRSGGKRMDASG